MLKFENGYHHVVTNFKVRPIEFSGKIFSLNEELTCEKLLNAFNEFVKDYEFIGGLEKIHDSYYNETLYPTNSVPDYLYHYTNINTLALILQQRRIRLNNLSNMDDLNEGKTNDYENLGQYCFASCWTQHSEESIPFWNMYTNKLAGVRIRLKSNPFRIFEVNDDTKLIKGSSQINISEQFKIAYPEEVWFNEKYLPMPPYDNILEKVVYTEDPNTFIPEIYNRADNFEKLSLHKLGRFKRKEWEFQGEWRYKVVLTPVGISEVSSLGEAWFDVVRERIKNKVDIGIKHIYLDIDEHAFNDMEVVLGPMAREGDKLIVEALLNKYNKSAILKDSVLKGQVR